MQVKHYSIRLPPAMLDALHARAAQEYMSTHALILRALRHYLAHVPPTS